MEYWIALLSVIALAVAGWVYYNHWQEDLWRRRQYFVSRMRTMKEGIEWFNTLTDPTFAKGYFSNHDPEGDTLYGADVYVDPKYHGHGVGSALTLPKLPMPVPP